MNTLMTFSVRELFIPVRQILNGWVWFGDKPEIFWVGKKLYFRFKKIYHGESVLVFWRANKVKW